MSEKPKHRWEAVRNRLPPEGIHTRMASYVIVADGLFRVFGRVSVALGSLAAFLVIEMISMALFEA